MRRGVLGGKGRRRPRRNALNAEDTEDAENVTAPDVAVHQSRAVVVLGVLGVESGCRR